MMKKQIKYQLNHYLLLGFSLRPLPSPSPLYPPRFFPRYALGKELKTYRMKVCSLYLTSFGNFQSGVF